MNRHSQATQTRASALPGMKPDVFLAIIFMLIAVAIILASLNGFLRTEIALRYGNRLIMMHEGKIIFDLDHAQRSNLKVSDLVAAFEQASGKQFADDSILLNAASTHP